MARSLDVSNNLLEGEIPKEIEGLYNLRKLSWRKNQLTGPVPDEIGACALLRSLFAVRYLNFRGNLFTGITEWMELGRIQIVDLSKNMFSGAVPDAIGNIQSLRILNISDNGFSGSLPASMINCENVQILDAVGIR
ncbi:putative non-specific serine/threonine protein kinase [Helianthus annuus]|nr:putative non-specific serine/threonine protein kinase [Helianthus annuus]